MQISDDSGSDEEAESSRNGTKENADEPAVVANGDGIPPQQNGSDETTGAVSLAPTAAAVSIVKQAPPSAKRFNAGVSPLSKFEWQRLLSTAAAYRSLGPVTEYR